MLVTGGNSAGDFLKLLGNGKDFGLKRLNYSYQEGEGGIADALRLAEHFVDGEPVCVILGDNIIEGNIARAADEFRKQQQGAKILLKEVKNPQRFGVPILEGDRVVKIEEKPRIPDRRMRSRACIFMMRAYSTSSRRSSRRAEANSKLPMSIMPISRMEH